MHGLIDGPTALCTLALTGLLGATLLPAVQPAGKTLSQTDEVLLQRLEGLRNEDHELEERVHLLLRDSTRAGGERVNLKPKAERALRALLGEWFDVRQSLRLASEVELRQEQDVLAEELSEFDAGERRFGVVEESAWAAREGELEELREEEHEAIGFALETVDGGLGDTWYEIVATDPEGADVFLTSLRLHQPRVWERVLRAGGGDLAQHRARVALVEHLVSAALVTPEEDENEEAAEDRIVGLASAVEEGDADPELMALVRAVVEAERGGLRQASADLQSQRDRLPRRVRERAGHRETLIELELLRLTGAEDLLEW